MSGRFAVILSTQNEGSAVKWSDSKVLVKYDISVVIFYTHRHRSHHIVVDKKKIYCKYCVHNYVDKKAIKY